MPVEGELEQHRHTERDKCAHEDEHQVSFSASVGLCERDDRAAVQPPDLGCEHVFPDRVGVVVANEVGFRRPEPARRERRLRACNTGNPAATVFAAGSDLTMSPRPAPTTEMPLRTRSERSYQAYTVLLLFASGSPSCG